MSVPSWANASATYADNLCKIIKSEVVIAILQVNSSGATPGLLSTPVEYDVTRDDGQLIRFTIQGGALVVPPSITMKLQVIGSGYVITDAADNLETYDTNGILQSITNRSGIAQTLNYDASSRLSSVTDSFGHRLSFGYDPQNRLTTVTRQ